MVYDSVVWKHLNVVLSSTVQFSSVYLRYCGILHRVSDVSGDVSISAFINLLTVQRILFFLTE
jgi:hypothetical protein